MSKKSPAQLKGIMLNRAGWIQKGIYRSGIYEQRFLVPYGYRDEYILKDWVDGHSIEELEAEINRIKEIGNIELETVEYKDIANKIVFALNQYGAELGNVSNRIIENVLKESKDFVILKRRK